MSTDMELEIRMAVAAGRAMAMESGADAGRVVLAETTARVNGLLALTLGMFGFSVAAAVVAGMLWL